MIALWYSKTGDNQTPGFHQGVMRFVPLGLLKAQGRMPIKPKVCKVHIFGLIGIFGLYTIIRGFGSAGQRIADLDESEDCHTLDESVIATEVSLCTHEERVSLAGQVCKEKGILQWDEKVPLKQYPDMIVDELHQMMFCFFAKAASTSWLTLLARASGHWKPGMPTHARGKDVEKFGLKTLHSFSESEAHQKLASYKKVLVVRHPLTRLASTWRDKFLMPDSIYYREKVGKKILKKYRGKYTEGDTCTFNEFVQFIVDGAEDVHWDTYDECKPCLVHYDYISRTETIHLDSTEITTILNASQVIPSEHAHNAKDQKLSSLALLQYKNVTAQQMNKLLTIYGQDMKMFGYEFDACTFTADCLYPRHSRDCC